MTDEEDGMSDTPGLTGNICCQKWDTCNDACSTLTGTLRRKLEEAERSSNHFQECLGNADAALDTLEVENEQLQQQLAEARTLHPVSEWHDDTGNAVWWHVPIQEAPYVGRPDDSDWIEGWYTHFTKLIVPDDAALEASHAE